MTSREVVSAAAAACLAAFVAGCSGAADDAPILYPVTGAVTLGGKPVPSGEIQFLPIDGQGRPDATAIADGKYSLEVAAGEKKVVVTASRDTGKTITGAMGETTPVTEQYVPRKYNSATTLTADVKSDGANVLDFDLDAK